MVNQDYRFSFAVDLRKIRIASIFARSGVMVRPWRDAGFSVVTFDIEEAMHPFLHIQADLMKLEPQQFDVVFCFPPCTHLASSGARWWKSKGPQALQEGLAMVEVAKKWSILANFWMIENPVGRLSTHWRKPDWYFNPCDFAGYSGEPSNEAYTKRTCIWTNMPKPQNKAVEPVLGSKMHLMPPTKDRAYRRSVTPEGFSNAVFLSMYQKVIQDFVDSNGAFEYDL